MAMASLCWFWQAGGSIGFGTSCFCFALLHFTHVRSYYLLCKIYLNATQRLRYKEVLVLMLFSS